MSVPAAAARTAARSASGAAGRGASTAKAAKVSTGKGDVNALARKLAAKSSGPEQTADALAGLGYTKAEARLAADAAHGTSSTSSTPAKKRKPAAGAPRPATRRPASTPAPEPGPVVEPAPRSLPSLPTVRAPELGGNASGFVLGLVGMAVLINFMRGGTAGVRQWAAAKFLNRTTSTPAAPSTRGSSGRSGLPGAKGTRPPAAGGGAGGGGSSPW